MSTMRALTRISSRRSHGRLFCSKLSTMNALIRISRQRSQAALGCCSGAPLGCSGAPLGCCSGLLLWAAALGLLWGCSGPLWGLGQLWAPLELLGLLWGSSGLSAACSGAALLWGPLGCSGAAQVLVVSSVGGTPGVWCLNVIGRECWVWGVPCTGSWPGPPPPTKWGKEPSPQGVPLRVDT